MGAALLSTATSFWHIGGGGIPPGTGSNPVPPTIRNHPLQVILGDLQAGSMRLDDFCFGQGSSSKPPNNKRDHDKIQYKQY